MKTLNRPGSRLLRADANALGGYLQAPLETTLPTLSPVSLPATGGFAAARTAAYSQDEWLSCSASYSKVSGKGRGDGSHSLLLTSVIEDLNLLEIVRARRIVAQVAVEVPADGGAIKISLAGSGFEGLVIAGQPCIPTLNGSLQDPGPGRDCCDGLTWEDVQKAGGTQGDTLRAGLAKHSEETRQWALSQCRRMTADAKAAVPGMAQASLVDALPGFGRGCGHIVEIPQFGRIIFGELRLTRYAVQLIGIRAHLDCGHKGGLTILCVGGGSTDDD